MLRRGMTVTNTSCSTKSTVPMWMGRRKSSGSSGSWDSWMMRVKAARASNESFDASVSVAVDSKGLRVSPQATSPRIRPTAVTDAVPPPRRMSASNSLVKSYRFSNGVLIRAHSIVRTGSSRIYEAQ